MNPGTVPRVSIIVPCRNEVAFIGRFVANVFAQERVAGGFELLIADGHSTDGTRERLGQLAASEPRLIIVDNPAGAVSPGLNATLRRARGEIVLRMDVHTDYAADYANRCIATLEATGADNVGGPAQTRATGYVARAIALGYGSPFAVGGARFHDVTFRGEVDTVPYGCWHRLTLAELGGFDEELVRNQDDELNLRLRRRGGRIWQEPLIRSWYHPRPALTALFRQYFQYGYWKVRVIRKHRLPASWRHLVPGATVAAGAGLALLAPFSSMALSLGAIATGAWLTLACVAAVAACRRARDWSPLPLLPLVFATYHAAYGLGFLKGLLGSRARQRASDTAMAELTR